ncbi:hypothetical protein GCM10010910_15620 [Microbacterium nanhaiense]|uniref:Secreted protein n=1 Tax=Microbacterium nanhaiense TaxID=1301026 RepID=A0ABQ2N1J9_9MICO|nr:hypothetical protein [Microbacterium nanhaiense]GGO63326.1 hypothetical protein GCM10010910_15620 [Microbacterium nanhaiense]
MSRTRSRLGAFLGAAALITASLVAAPPAAAAVLPGGLATSFEIDGDSGGAVDWNTGAFSPYTTSSGNLSTGVLAKQIGSDACGAPDPTTFTNGSKIDGTWPPNATPTSVQTKADLCSAGSAYEIVDVGGTNHVILYLNWTRVTGGTGDLTVYQHLQGAGAGRTGDLLIEFNYDPSSGTSVDALRWNGSAWASSPATETCQAVVAPSQTFGEMAIDLTASGLIPTDRCSDFTTGQVLSRTGNSQNANIEDFLNPPSLTINTCASLQVEKVVEGAVPEGLGFPYQVSQKDGADLGTPAGATDSDGSEATITSTIQGGQTHTWMGLVTSPDYMVQELTGELPAGVTLKSVVCSATNFFAPGAPRTDVVLYENGSATGNVFPVFPDALGGAPRTAPSRTRPRH